MPPAQRYPVEVTHYKMGLFRIYAAFAWRAFEAVSHEGLQQPLNARKREAGSEDRSLICVPVPLCFRQLYSVLQALQGP